MGLRAYITEVKKEFHDVSSPDSSCVTIDWL